MTRILLALAMMIVAPPVLAASLIVGLVLNIGNGLKESFRAARRALSGIMRTLENALCATVER